MEDSRIILVDNVWASCSASSEEADFKREKARLLIRVRERIVAAGWTPGEATARLSLSDKQLQALLDGQVSEPGLKPLYPTREVSGICFWVSVAMIQNTGR